MRSSQPTITDQGTPVAPISSGVSTMRRSAFSIDEWPEIYRLLPVLIASSTSPRLPP